MNPSEWISINDAVPDNYKTVLVYADGFTTYASYRHKKTGEIGTGWMFRIDDGQDGTTIWFSETNISHRKYKTDITHWMPIPLGPNDH